MVFGESEESVVFALVPAVVENCVLMHGTEIGKDAKVKNIITNTFVKITDGNDVGCEKGVVYIDK